MNIQAQQRSEGISWRGILKHRAAWYGSQEAIRIADNALMYQHENGGWSKNIDRARVLDECGKVKVAEERKTARSTVDKSATVTQLNYLARVYRARDRDRFKDGILRGIDYLLDAPYENGGWPQYFPSRKGYYQHITYNDDAMIGVMRVLRDVVQERQPYAFIDQSHRNRAATAIHKGLDIILQAQITVGGRLTAWRAQHAHKTLEPAKKDRAYELPSIKGGESRGIVLYLNGNTPS